MPDLRPEPPSRPRDVPVPAPKVAALFIEYRGVYFNRSDVVPAGYAIGEDRNSIVIKYAQSYDGPWPIVAHPPCARWGSFATAPWLPKEKRKVGNDGGMFESALNSVRKWGGVLEHPANSKAWRTFNLRKPGVHRITTRDPSGGFSIFVNQSNYGHLAQKPTWIYICGYRGDFEEDFYIPQGKKRVKYEVRKTNKLELPHLLRKKTPELFANLLISIAKRCTFYRDHWTDTVPWLNEKREGTP